VNGDPFPPQRYLFTLNLSQTAQELTVLLTLQTVGLSNEMHTVVSNAFTNHYNVLAVFRISIFSFCRI